MVLGSGSLASFTPGRVELRKGQMSFDAVTGGLVFAASTLRIEPTAEKSAANVTLQDRKATVTVTKGSLRVVDPSGIQLASLHVGEARLFEEASTAAQPSASAPPPPPAEQRSKCFGLGIGPVCLGLKISGK